MVFRGVFRTKNKIKDVRLGLFFSYVVAEGYSWEVLDHGEYKGVSPMSWAVCRLNKGDGTPVAPVDYAISREDLSTFIGANVANMRVTVGEIKKLLAEYNIGRLSQIPIDSLFSFKVDVDSIISAKEFSDSESPESPDVTAKKTRKIQHNWSDEDVKNLKAYVAENMPPRFIATRMGRSVLSINKKKRKLGLYFKKRKLNPRGVK